MADTEEPEKKNSKLKLIIIILGAVFLLIILAIALWWFLFRQAPVELIVPVLVEDVASVGPAEVTQQTQVTDTPRTMTSIVSLPTVTVNLLDGDTLKYLKIGMDVELSTEAAKQEIEANSARIRDSIIILLSSKTYAELVTSEGKMQLKNEVTVRLNQILGIPRVVRVYFTEFVIQ